MNTIVQLETLTNVPIKTVWPHEALSFTPWLDQNLHKIGDLLGLNLESNAREHEVGNFRADIVARCVDDDRLVLIENQFGKADHSHLGQIMAYLAGSEAKIIIWIAEKFGDEHVSAIRWLNEHSDLGYAFFAVTVKIVQIRDSAKAILLEVAEKPVDWGGEFREKQRSSKYMRQLQMKAFWTLYGQNYPEQGAIKLTDGNKRNWIAVGNSEWNVVRFVGYKVASICLRTSKSTSFQDDCEKIAHLKDYLENRLGTDLSRENCHPFDKYEEFETEGGVGKFEAMKWLNEQTQVYQAELSKIIHAGDL